MIPELERRFNDAEDLMTQVGGCALDETYKKAILLGIVDPATRQMTANEVEVKH